MPGKDQAGHAKNEAGDSPVPSSSTHVFQFLLVTHSMLRKDPEQRPTVQQLLALPSLQHAVAEARRLARAMKPDVYLPPMAQASAAVCLCKCVCGGGWLGVWVGNAFPGSSCGYVAVPATR